MPTRALQYCSVPTCREKVPSGRCPTHQQQARAQETRYQHGATGYGRQWRKARAQYFSDPAHVLCVTCQVAGKVVLAEELDHIVPHRGDQALFWDRTNWQGLCRTHHAEKTARETLVKG